MMMPLIMASAEEVSKGGNISVKDGEASMLHLFVVTDRVI